MKTSRNKKCNMCHYAVMQYNICSVQGPCNKQSMALLHFAWKAKQFFLPNRKEVTLGWEKLRNEIYNLGSLLHIIMAVRWVQHVECKTVENFFKMLVRQPEDKNSFGRQTRTWKTRRCAWI
jgi:hypothetical protein